jgi:hypothetical protein
MNRELKIICTTSDKYHHILPIFCFLFNKYWSPGQKVEIVGYKESEHKLPPNFTFVSLGEQKGDAKNFTRDLRVHFAKQDQFFIWVMEDTFLTQKVDFNKLQLLNSLTNRENIGRINLCREVTKQDHIKYDNIQGVQVYENNKISLYRLSTQMSIWNRDFALKYMQNDLTPWEFECQSDHAVDEYRILGLDYDSPVTKNEGVRKTNIYNYNFDNLPLEIIEEMRAKKFF